MTRAVSMIALLPLAACARQVGSAVVPDAPGFLLGLWHGFIFPLAWASSCSGSARASRALSMSNVSCPPGAAA